MLIEKIKVEGFRLLESVEFGLEENSTVIVGRNNSGKTSFTSIFDCFCGESGARFRLEDFSVLSREKFLKAKELREEGGSPEKILEALPRISLTLTFRYNKFSPDLGSLSPFVIDLDEDSTTAIVRIEYRPILKNMHLLFDLTLSSATVEPRTHFYKNLKSNLSKAYGVHVSAIDPTDSTNIRDFEGTSALTALLQCNFVLAQRNLDKTKLGDADVIGKLLSELFKTATAPSAAEADQDLAIRLKQSVESIEHNVQLDFDGMLKELLPVMNVMGFPSLNDTEIRPETSLNVESLLSGHTKVVYSGVDGVHLPEGYNGLGTRNLIYMLLQLASYHKIYRSKSIRLATHLIFIEEPEAHLHPQMQEVFINQLNVAVQKLSDSYSNEDKWNIQFIITTHSPHVANAATFDAVRYFYNERDKVENIRHTKVKDFKKGLSSVSDTDQKFLHQYMTLTKCDLYFADKAILVEGTTERLLMPRLCQLVDETLDESQKLARQYVTCVEVGGAYAHIFYPLLDFLELKTLVITDLDSTKKEMITKNGKQVEAWVKCPVADGENISNAAIKNWFYPKDVDDTGKVKKKAESDDSQISPSVLIAKTAEEKQVKFRRIAYQIPEDPESNICGRSYEDAFILANLSKFKLPIEQDIAIAAWEKAKGLKKADFALEYAIQIKDWLAPRYIKEGLIWLSEMDTIENSNFELITGEKVA
ncbi:ATP-dependent nuclease [Acinetobacter haemolyticus]|uniref:ATP-dependent nuclease n=1 Tax=Acinetobacter haemolyticus TaxID=29430 RepID=UPI000949222C|nr:ATP-dependent endonuclease [Acinetobacter haemolyticus]APR71252.1 ATP-dependent endonuclease [Acinetobacter haemolyticus]